MLWYSGGTGRSRRTRRDGGNAAHLLQEKGGRPCSEPGARRRCAHNLHEQSPEGSDACAELLRARMAQLGVALREAPATGFTPTTTIEEL